VTPFELDDLADLVLVASRVLGVEVDAVLGLLDVDAAHAALAAAKDAAATAGPAAPAGPAAALLGGLLRGPALARGNQRVALAATLQLLALAGRDLDLDPPEATCELLAGVAAGRVGQAELTGWLAGRLRQLPAGAEDPADDDKETGMFQRLAGRRRRRQGGRSRGGGGMFERFTDRARTAVTLAQEEARDLRHNYIGTEHILLGLVREGDGVAARVLDSLGVSLDAVRARVEAIIGRGKESPAGHIPFTPRSKKVLELALREALSLGHNDIGTEHILLGLVREGEGVAAQVLVELGADLPRVRQQVKSQLAMHASSPEASAERGRVLQEKVGEVLRENERLHVEVQRLRGLLEQHGVDPDEGRSKSA
jgi:Clp amino terminal domain, pathogenicity island component